MDNDNKPTSTNHHETMPHQQFKPSHRNQDHEAGINVQYFKVGHKNYPSDYQILQDLYKANHKMQVKNPYVAKTNITDVSAHEKPQYQRQSYKKEKKKGQEINQTKT